MSTPSGWLEYVLGANVNVRFLLQESKVRGRGQKLGSVSGPLQAASHTESWSRLRAPLKKRLTAEWSPGRDPSEITHL